MQTNLAPVLSEKIQFKAWLAGSPLPPPKGCVLPPPISRSVIGSTTDFGSVSFGSIPDGKAFIERNKNVNSNNDFYGAQHIVHNGMCRTPEQCRKTHEVFSRS